MPKQLDGMPSFPPAHGATEALPTADDCCRKVCHLHFACPFCARPSPGNQSSGKMTFTFPFSTDLTQVPLHAPCPQLLKFQQQRRNFAGLTMPRPGKSIGSSPFPPIVSPNPFPATLVPFTPRDSLMIALSFFYAMLAVSFFLLSF